MAPPNLHGSAQSTTSHLLYMWCRHPRLPASHVVRATSIIKGLPHIADKILSYATFGIYLHYSLFVVCLNSNLTGRAVFNPTALVTRFGIGFCHLMA